MKNNCNVSSLEMHQKIRQERMALPIAPIEKEFLEAIAKNDSHVVIGETACGKTTQIPQFLFKAGYADKGIIACTQPRRVAAITVAERVALEQNTNLGERVGYSVRFDDKTSSATKIKFMTDGMLLREAIGDRNLSRYSFILLDEAHERTVQTDILFGIVKQAQQNRNKEGSTNKLKLIVMSATMDPDKYKAYLNNAPAHYIEGRKYVIETNYIKTPSDEYLDLVASAVLKINQSEPVGDDILVFLTGQEEIKQLAKFLRETNKVFLGKAPPLKVFPLYASLQANQQRKAFQTVPKKCRKVVLATNIAETSVTIHGIKFVVDSGKVKRKSFDPTRGIDKLKVEWISKAEAIQRKGRAGRQKDGVVYRMYTEEMFQKFNNETTPEIKRCSASNTILQLIAMGINSVAEFDFFDKPDDKTIKKAVEELVLLDAIERDLNKEDGYNLTQLGKKMSRFPLEPKLPKALLTAEKNGCIEELLTLVSMLSVDTVFITPSNAVEEAKRRHNRFESSVGDFITLIQVYRAYNKEGSRKWCQENFVSERFLQQAKDIRKQLRALCLKNNVKISSDRDFKVVRKCVASGMFAQAAEYQTDGSYKTLATGQKVMIHPSSCLHFSKPAHVVYSELVETTNCYMRNICVVDPFWLQDAAPEYFRSKLDLRI